MDVKVPATTPAATTAPAPADILALANDVLKTNDVTVPPAKVTTSDEKGTPPAEKKYLWGDVEIAKEDIPVIRKLYKTKPEKDDSFDDIEKLSGEYSNLTNWKNKNAERGRELNQKETELNNRLKEVEAQKESYATHMKQVKEDLQKEAEINKDFDAKEKTIYDSRKAKKKEFADAYPDDPERAEDEYDEWWDRNVVELSALKIERKNALADHKNRIESVEKEQAEREKNLFEGNVFNLTYYFPEEFPTNEVVREIQHIRTLTPEQQKNPETLNNYPYAKKILELGVKGTSEGVINFKTYHELQLLREAAKNYATEKAEYEKKVTEAEKTGYNKALKEIEAKGISISALTEGDKSISTDGKSLKDKERQRYLNDLAGSVLINKT